MKKIPKEGKIDKMVDGKEGAPNAKGKSKMKAKVAKAASKAFGGR
jgi:hypothetical protein